MALYKGTKKGICYKGDYLPCTFAIGDKVIDTYEIKEGNTSDSPTFTTEYKTSNLIDTVEGNTEFDTGTLDYQFSTEDALVYTEDVPSDIVYESEEYQPSVKKTTKQIRVKSVGGITTKSENLLVFDDSSVTKNSITCTVTNGIITINGTATANSVIGISISNSIPIGTYTLKRFQDGTASNDFDVWLTTDMKTGDTSPLKTYGNGDVLGKATTTEVKTMITIYVRQDYAFENIKVKLMLISGTTAPTSWSQGFSGLRYNSPTEVESGDNKLLDGKITSIKSYLVSLGYDSDVLGYGIDKDNCNYIDLLGKVFHSNCTLSDDGTEIVNRTTPVLVDLSSVLDDSDSILEVEDGGTITVENEYEQELPLVYDYAVDGSLEYPHPYFPSKIEEASVKVNENDAVSLDTYSVGDVKDKIYVNQETNNLLNIADGTYTSSGVTIVISNGVATMSGTATSSAVVNIAKKLNITSGTYYAIAFCTNYNNNNGISLTPWSSVKYFGTPNVGNVIEVTDTKTNLGIYIASGTSYDGAIVKPMLVNGTSAPTEFEPYLKGKVWKYSKVGKVDLGTLEYTGSTLGTTKGYYNNTIQNVAKLSYDNSKATNIICSNYKTYIRNEYNGEDKSIVPVASGNVYIVDNRFSTRASIKASLSGTYLYYELATPTWEDITDTDEGQALLSMATTPNTENTITTTNCDVGYTYYKHKEG